jgi:glycosyltransferase involved in cell wall biosynthesis
MAQVAVIVPAFNPGIYLHAALASLVLQTCADWECVVVDDGSTEDLSWVAAMDPRIRLVRQPNAGVSAARNRAIAETTGPIIAFLDQDDEWLPEYLALQLEEFANLSVVLSSAAFEIIDEAGVRIGPGFTGHNASYEDLLTGCGLQLSTVMVRRSAVEIVGGFRPFAISQDWDLWLRIAREGGLLGRVEQTLGRWRVHASNGSRDYAQLWRDGRTILSSHDHPAVRQGLRRVRFLSGVQAFDRAREPRCNYIDRVRALLWAATHAPLFTGRSLLRRLWLAAR